MEGLDGWLRHLETLHPKAMDLGLERVSQVFARLAIPQSPERTIVVAGTNGKGSTVSYATGLLIAMGYDVVSYTSPHLFRFNERIARNGKPIDDATLIAAFAAIEEARDEISLSYFEFATLAAMWVASKLDNCFRVFEVGLGGRLDAVNLFNSGCPIITSIGLDHTEYLGDTRDLIAYEKAGVLRSGYPAVCGDSEPPPSLIEHARERQVALALVDQDYGVKHNDSSVSFWDANMECPVLDGWILPGAHQRRNAACAIESVLRLCDTAQVQRALISRQLGRSTLAGRMQLVSQKPDIFVDVGHNPDAAHAVVDVMGPHKGGKLWLILAMLKDKDARTVCQILNEKFDHVLFAGISGDRGQTSENLAEKVLQSNDSTGNCFDTVPEALRHAIAQLGSNDSLLVFGSFSGAEQALRYCQDKSG